MLCFSVLALAPAHASSTRYCDDPPPLTAEQKDKLFRFGAVIKDELQASGHGLAFIARSGLDLGRFGVRYSHAGLSLKGGLATPWAVRQLYYACEEQRPRVFDQGISGFLLGLDDPAIGYISVVFVPPAQAEALQRRLLDPRQALALLGATYSANAHAFSLQYQNCNQWVAEMLAVAWGGLGGAGSSLPPASSEALASAEPAVPALAPSLATPTAVASPDLRAQAQAWLKAQGYRPRDFELGWSPLVWLTSLSRWLHHDDHPLEDQRQAVFRVSMPESIEAFVRATVPGATRMEFCHRGPRVVVRRGWAPLPEGCVPEAGDTVVMLD
ncbi:MAG: hypothetical protein AD742_18775 [Methylibium sp. NZG]|nr:MAG: hypothetical protein AD742_18775 [Methylibium sp. NZG]